MQTIEDVFIAFGGPAKIGQAVGISTEHAAAMKRRNSIPVAYWPALIASARERGISCITYESLTLLHAERAAS
jgi:hypothetical protein